MFHSVLLFLNIGGSEMILIVFVALLLFGGEKLPQIARTLGKGIRDFKDASEGVKREINNQINSYEEKKRDEPEATSTPAALPQITPVENTIPAAQEHTVADSYNEAEHTLPVATEEHLLPQHEVAQPVVEQQHTEVTTAEQHHEGAVKAEEIKTTHE